MRARIWSGSPDWPETKRMGHLLSRLIRSHQWYPLLSGSPNIKQHDMRLGGTKHLHSVAPAIRGAHVIPEAHEVFAHKSREIRIVFYD